MKRQLLRSMNLFHRIFIWCYHSASLLLILLFQIYEVLPLRNIFVILLLDLFQIMSVNRVKGSFLRQKVRLLLLGDQFTVSLRFNFLLLLLDQQRASVFQLVRLHDVQEISIVLLPIYLNVHELTRIRRLSLLQIFIVRLLYP